MTGKQLKNAILQLAIQGKLVPQDPADEPASALLARIRKEKEQLVKAGKKDLETTPIADDEKPFEIPESWEWVRLGVLCSHVIDCPHSTPTKSVTPTNHPCIRTSEIKGGAIVWDSMQYLDEKNYQIRISRLKPEAGDIVYAREGVYGDAVVLPDGYEFCLGQRTMMMRMVAKEFVPYIHKAIISPFVYEQAKKLNREGTTNVGHVNMSDIVTFVIPLPPLSEQKRIVAKIEELMPLVEEFGAAQEKLDRLNEALPEALKKSILQQAIQGKLVPQDANDEPASALLARIRKEKEQLVKAGKLKPACRQAGKKDFETTPITDEEKPFEIPESWEWVRLGDIGIFERGNGIKREETFSSGKPCVRYGEMYTKYRYNPTFDKTFSYTSQAVFDKCRKAHNGDLFMALTGENKQDIALAAQYIGKEDIAVGGDLCHFSILQAYALYFVYVINSQFFSDKKELLATGDIIVHISADKLGSIPIPLPPLAEQRRIVARVEELLEMVEGMK